MIFMKAHEEKMALFQLLSMNYRGGLPVHKPGYKPSDLL